MGIVEDLRESTARLRESTAQLEYAHSGSTAVIEQLQRQFDARCAEIERLFNQLEDELRSR